MRRSEIIRNAPSDKVAEEAATQVAPLVELKRITLAKTVHSDEGQVPVGSSGTIVHVWKGGTACEVEFSKPFHAIATVKLDAIDPA